MGGGGMSVCAIEVLVRRRVCLLAACFLGWRRWAVCVIEVLFKRRVRLFVLWFLYG